MLSVREEAYCGSDFLKQIRWRVQADEKLKDTEIAWHLF